MNTTPSSPTPVESSRAVFVTTHWSVVVAAGGNDTPVAAEALSRLCETYWYPLYAYVRRQGHAPHDAQDLTQAFFARLLAKNYIQLADREKGRFRTFLLVALKRFLANEWRFAQAKKRGGDHTILSFDTAMAEQRYQSESSTSLSADSIYERRWALALVDQSLARLRTEFERAGRAVEFEHLKHCLTAERGDVSYEEIAVALKIPPGTARVAVHRLRKRFREIFREEIAQTLANPDELDDEIRHLMAVLAG